MNGWSINLNYMYYCRVSRPWFYAWYQDDVCEFNNAEFHTTKIVDDKVDCVTPAHGQIELTMAASKRRESSTNHMVKPTRKHTSTIRRTIAWRMFYLNTDTLAIMRCQMAWIHNWSAHLNISTFAHFDCSTNVMIITTKLVTALNTAFRRCGVSHKFELEYYCVDTRVARQNCVVWCDFQC